MGGIGAVGKAIFSKAVKEFTKPERINKIINPGTSQTIFSGLAANVTKTTCAAAPAAAGQFFRRLSPKIVEEFNPITLFRNGIYGEKNFFMLFNNENMVKLLKKSGEKEIIKVLNKYTDVFRVFRYGSSSQAEFLLKEPVVQKYLSKLFNMKKIHSQPTFYRMVSKSEIDSLLKSKSLKPTDMGHFCLTEEPLGIYGHDAQYRITFNHNIDNKVSFSSGNCTYRVGSLSSYSLDDVAKIEQIISKDGLNSMTLKTILG